MGAMISTGFFPPSHTILISCLRAGGVRCCMYCTSVCSIFWPMHFFDKMSVSDTIICSCWLCVAFSQLRDISLRYFLHRICRSFLYPLKGDSVRRLTQLWLCDSRPFPFQITVYYCWRSYLVSLFYYPLISCSHCHQMQLQNRRREGFHDETDIITLCECKWVYVVR